LEYFLVERYCLYAQDKKGNLYRGDIHHQPWPLQPAEADVRTNTVSQIVLPNIAPILQYVERIDIVAWLLKKI
ncbi:MAG: DUF2071 domain-containing protein, partial [Phototrophicales bacterium]